MYLNFAMDLCSLNSPLRWYGQLKVKINTDYNRSEWKKLTEFIECKIVKIKSLDVTMCAAEKRLEGVTKGRVWGACKMQCVTSEEKVRHLTVHCVRGTRTQPLICVGCAVHYWVSCAINKGGFFEIAFSSSTHICLALRRWLTFCLTLTL